jgi:hypothetical protein
MSARGTWIAGIAAAIGLVVSAVSTVYTGLAFNNQTDQQREQSATDNAKQAARLNAYLSPATKTTGELAVIDNTSGLPAYAVKIGIATRTESASAKKAMTAVNEINLLVGTVLPCTKVTVDLRAAIAMVKPTAFTHAKGAFRSATSPEAKDGLVVQFYDAAGKLWWRDSGAGGPNAEHVNAPRLGLVESEWADRGYESLDDALPADNPRWGRTVPISTTATDGLTVPVRTAKASLCGSE